MTNDIGEIRSTSCQPLRVFIVNRTKVEPIGINGRTAEEEEKVLVCDLAMNCAL